MRRPHHHDNDRDTITAPVTDALPIVDLCERAVPGLIVSHPSGVAFTNQVGGYACHHPVMEGVYIPLNRAELHQAFDQYFFYGPKWQGHCYRGIDEETADVVDRLLASHPLTRGIVVDRSRLGASVEAWIHVTIAPQDDGDDMWTAFAGRPAVLTWENSD